MPTGNFSESPIGGEERISKWESYHLIMQAYAGYTVAKIEEELSFREVDELVKSWEKSVPAFVNIRDLTMLFAGFVGADLEAARNKPKKGSFDDTIEAFKLIGAL